MIARIAGILALALVGAASLYEPDARACAASGTVWTPSCGDQCELQYCNSSGGGSTWAYPCGSCPDDGWIFCCANDCYCGENG
jgi:hypothetical protein